MLRVSCGVFRRFVQQVFRNHTGLLEFYLRLRRYRLEADE